MQNRGLYLVLKSLKVTYALVLGILTCCWTSCREDFESISSNGQLQFSRDTVFFDTLFTKIKSTTQQLKVYNRSSEDVHLSSIELSNGAFSKYQMNVNGFPNTNEEYTSESGKFFKDITIPKNDSIFIFIETTLDLEDEDLEVTEDDTTGGFIYTDQILFKSAIAEQELELFSLVKDAKFLFPDESSTVQTYTTTTRNEQGDFITVEGYYLEASQLQISNSKATIIYGNAVVPSGETLQVAAGSRLFFHHDASLLVESGAALEFLGMPSENPDDPYENSVILTSDRLNEDYNDLSGQWGYIWFMEGYLPSRMENTLIKNSAIGLWVQGTGASSSSELQLKNVEIYNTQSSGILATSTSIVGENVVVNNSGGSSVRLEEGGSYQFTHATFASYRNLGFESAKALVVSNVSNPDSSVTNTAITNTTFTNCIFVGSTFSELSLNNDTSNDFEVLFTNCLITTPTSSFTTENFPDTTAIDTFQDCIFNDTPDFKDVFGNELQISESSAANGTARTLLPIGADLLNQPRSAESPDIGAYESQDFDANDSSED